MTIKTEDIDFTSATKVISSAQKFIIPVPAFGNKGEPLVHPDGEKSGQPIVDYKGNPIGDNGIVFFNAKDKSWQAATGDGKSVIIINQVTEEQAVKLYAKVNSVLSHADLDLEEKAFRASGAKKYGLESAAGHFNKRTINNLSLDELKSILQYAEKELCLVDMYNSDKAFIASKMTSVGEGSGITAFGIHKRDDRDICLAVYISGNGRFHGPAASPQQFENGAVIVKQGDSVRLVQPDIFEETYRHADGAHLKVKQLATKIPPHSMEQVKKVIDELQSGYGDSSSYTKPCKEIIGVRLKDHFYDPAEKEIYANIAIQSYRQSPYGDSANTEAEFSLKLSEIDHLSAIAPPEFKKDFIALAENLRALEEKDSKMGSIPVKAPKVSK